MTVSAAKKKSHAVAESAVAENVPAEVPGILSLLCRRGIIFLCALVWFGAFAPLGIDLHHDGVMMIPALRVADGAMVFRDVFCQYGFLSPVLQGIALRFGGGELLVMKYFSVLFYAGSAVMLDIIWQDILSPRWRNVMLLMMFTLMPDLVVIFHPWSSIFALFFSLLALWSEIKYLKCGKLYWLFCAGIGAGITFLARHPVGVVTLIAILGTVFVESGIRASRMAAVKKFFIGSAVTVGGFLLVSGGIGILLAACGAWDDFVFQCVTYVFDFVSMRGEGGSEGQWRYFAASLCPFITDNGFFDSVFAIMPLLVLPWLYLCARRAMHKDGSDVEKDLILLCCGIFALGAWHQYYPVPCVRHIFWGGVPFFGFFVLTVARLWQMQKRKYLCRAGAVILLLWWAGCALPRLRSGYIRVTEFDKRRAIDIPGVRGIKFSRAETMIIGALRNCVDNLPDSIKARGVLNYTEDAMWSILLPDAGFKHKQFLVMKNGLYKDYDPAVMEFIRQRRPVVLSCRKLDIERYSEIFSAQYMGNDYRIYIPWE